MTGGFDLGSPDGSRTVITIGYCGDRAKNRGLDQAIAMLKAKYPNAEIREVRIEPGEPARKDKLDAFHYSPHAPKRPTTGAEP